MSLHRHHRKRRAQGGDDSRENIMLVTPELHRWIHDNPGLSYARGWLVYSWQDPAEIPITPIGAHVCECGGNLHCQVCYGDAA